MAKKMDARVKKSKKKFHNALISLMQEKRLEHITVKELCERSGLNRGTFYLHYQDVFELMQEVERGLEEGFSAVLERAPMEALYEDEQKPVLREVCRYFEEHAAAFRLFFCGQGDLPVKFNTHALCKILHFCPPPFRAFSRKHTPCKPAGKNVFFYYTMSFSLCQFYRKKRRPKMICTPKVSNFS